MSIASKIAQRVRWITEHAYDRRNHTRSLVAEGMLEHLALDYEHQRGAQSFHDALQARHRSTAP